MENLVPAKRSDGLIDFECFKGASKRCAFFIKIIRLPGRTSGQCDLFSAQREEHKITMDIFLRGLLIGFSIAAPVGPIGVLCIRRTLTDGRLAGFLSGMGAASADMFYGAVAAFGLTAVQELLIGQSDWLQIVGGIFLLYLGVKTFLTKPSEKAAVSARGGLFGAYLTTFFLTITNPITILSFIAIFAGLRLGETSGNYISATLMVLGVFLGSSAWWLTLSTGVSLLRDKFTPIWLTWVNQLAGAIIFVFGSLALLL
jgi:threonine/homoserine/homoserine lactone efflux protein